MYPLTETQLSNGFRVLHTKCPSGDINRIYGAVNHAGVWYIPCEFPFLSKAYEDIKRTLSYQKGLMTLDDALAAKIEARIEDYYREDIEIPDLGVTELRPHQILACKKTFQNPRFGLYMDCRTGKTLVMLYTIKHKGFKTLVVCPRIACENWMKEIIVHLYQR